MPIEIKIILLFGLCWFTYEYIKQSIIKLIKKKWAIKMIIFNKPIHRKTVKTIVIIGLIAILIIIII